MNGDNTYFFRPRVGKYYEEGFNGHRTLVLGQYLYCWRQECAYREMCTVQGLSRQLDLLCPLYSDKDDREYYRLSNSNLIEVDSYIEGEDYSAFSAFTHRMLGLREHLSPSVRAGLWDRVAFYNYVQHYFPDPEVFEYDVRKALLDRYFQAFACVLDELRPEVIYVWGDALKRILVERSSELNNAELECVRQFDAGFVSVWIFTAGYDGGKPVPDMRELDFAGNDFRSEALAAGQQSPAPQRRKKQKRWFITYLSGHPAVKGKLVYETVTAAIAQELWSAQKEGVIRVDFGPGGEEEILCPDPEGKSVIDLIDRLYDIASHGTGTFAGLLKYADITALLGVQPTNLYQKLHRLRSGRRSSRRKK